MFLCDDTLCLLNNLCYSKATAESWTEIRAGEYIIEPLIPSPPLPKHLALTATTVKVVILLLLVYCTPTVLSLILGACFYSLFYCFTVISLNRLLYRSFFKFVSLFLFLMVTRGCSVIVAFSEHIYLFWGAYSRKKCTSGK